MIAVITLDNLILYKSADFTKINSAKSIWISERDNEN